MPVLKRITSTPQVALKWVGKILPDDVIFSSLSNFYHSQPPGKRDDACSPTRLQVTQVGAGRYLRYLFQMTSLNSTPRGSNCSSVQRTVDSLDGLNLADLHIRERLVGGTKTFQEVFEEMKIRVFSSLSWKEGATGRKGIFQVTEGIIPRWGVLLLLQSSIFRWVIQEVFCCTEKNICHSRGMPTLGKKWGCLQVSDLSEHSSDSHHEHVPKTEVKVKLSCQLSTKMFRLLVSTGAEYCQGIGTRAAKVLDKILVGEV